MNYFIQSIFVIMVAILAIHYSGKTGLVIRKAIELYHGKKGCLPLPDLGNVTLHYFTGRGRGEAIRMLMEDNEIIYEDIRYTKEDWMPAKQKGITSGLLPFGQVPAIVTSKGASLVQSQAILHLIGRSVGLDCECEDLHICEVLALGVEDTKSKLSKILYNPEFSLADRDDYVRNVLPMWLNYWEVLAPSLKDINSCFFVGDHATWVDYMIFEMLDTNIEFHKHDVGPDASPAAFPLTRFPKLFHFYQRFASRPNLNKYLTDTKRIPYSIPNKPKA